MNIYKYTSIDSAINIVKSGKVILNSPKYFNDPFDCEIKINEKNNKKTFDLICNYNYFKFLTDLISNEELQLTKGQKILFMFVRLELKLFQSMVKITKGYERVPVISGFIKIVTKNNEKFEKEIKDAKTKYEKEIVGKLESIKENALISCFSKRNNSILMWSHYADSHHGVCIQFENETRDEFDGVSYSKKKPYFNLYLIVSRILASDYLHGNISLEDKSFNKQIMRPLFTKSDDWSYEEEIRCVYSSNQENKDIEFDMDRHYLKMQRIKKVYIGCKAEGTNLGDLIEKCQDRGIAVTFMKESNGSFSIIVDPNRKYSSVKKELIMKNCLENLLFETRKALDSNCYISAFSLALTIPAVCGKIYKPKLSEKERYIQWFQDYIGMYEHDVEQIENKCPYPSGDLIFALAQSIHKMGNTSVEGDYIDFHLDDFKLIIEQKNASESLYLSESGMEKDFNGNVKYTLQINIRDICNKIIWLAEVFNEKFKQEIDKMPKIATRDYDKDMDELNEIKVINQKDFS